MSLSPEIQNAINKYARKFDIDPLLVQALIQQESGFDPEAVSNKNAKGLGQIKGTAPVADAIEHGLLTKAPDQSTIDGQVEASVAYLATLRDKYGITDAGQLLQAYNGGPKAGEVPSNLNVEEYAAHTKNDSRFYTNKGTFNFKENVQYRDKILKNYQKLGGNVDAALGAKTNNQFIKSSTPTPRAQPVDQQTVNLLSQAIQPQLQRILDGNASEQDVANVRQAMQVSQQARDTQDSAFQNAAASIQQRNADAPQINFGQEVQGVADVRSRFAQDQTALNNQTKATILQQDQQRRDDLQALQDKFDLDATQEGSEGSNQLQRLIDLRHQLAVTQNAQARLDNASPLSAAGFYNFVLGNPYADGASILSGQIRDLNASATGIRAEVNQQRQNILDQQPNANIATTLNTLDSNALQAGLDASLAQANVRLDQDKLEQAAIDRENGRDITLATAISNSQRNAANQLTLETQRQSSEQAAIVNPLSVATTQLGAIGTAANTLSNVATVNNRIEASNANTDVVANTAANIPNSNRREEARTAIVEAQAADIDINRKLKQFQLNAAKYQDTKNFNDAQLEQKNRALRETLAEEKLRTDLVSLDILSRKQAVELQNLSDPIYVEHLQGSQKKAAEAAFLETGDKLYALTEARRRNLPQAKIDLAEQEYRAKIDEYKQIVENKSANQTTWERMSGSSTPMPSDKETVNAINTFRKIEQYNADPAVAAGARYKIYQYQDVDLADAHRQVATTLSSMVSNDPAYTKASRELRATTATSIVDKFTSEMNAKGINDDSKLSKLKVYAPVKLQVLQKAVDLPQAARRSLQQLGEIDGMLEALDKSTTVVQQVEVMDRGLPNSMSIDEKFEIMAGLYKGYQYGNNTIKGLKEIGVERQSGFKVRGEGVIAGAKTFDLSNPTGIKMYMSYTTYDRNLFSPIQPNNISNVLRSNP